MPTLYTMPGTCALATNIAVAWLDAPVEVRNMAYGDHKKDEYLAINPKGKVPAVAFEDGDVLTEAAAILSWLVAFNVINTYNDGVRKFLYWLDRLTDPLYRPVRAILPDFGGIDFSPIVVILVLYLIQGLLLDLQMQTVAL